MKRAYTITPEQYHEKRKEIERIGYKNGHTDPQTGKYTLSSYTAPITRKRFENLTKECDEMPIPDDKTFFLGTDIYNLWLNRHSDEPVTAKELYNIVASISQAIKQAESSARSAANWSGWDGR